MAVVVAAAPLFTCQLDAAGNLAIQQVSAFSVWGDDDRGRRRRVYVMNDSEVPAFASSLRELALMAHEEARTAALGR